MTNTKSSFPRVSVVVCTYNRAASLEKCLRSLAGQRYSSLEIIVVDGPSTDGTRAVIAKHPGTVLVEQDELCGLSHARNLGIAAATGEIVAFLDDDAVAAGNWLDVMVARLADPEVCGVGGKVISADGSAVQFMNGVVSIYGRSIPVQPEPRDHNSPRGPVFNNVMGTNMAFRRAALGRVGGFDNFISYYFDETDLAVRLIRSGCRIVHEPEAVVWHEHAAGHNRQSAFDLDWYRVAKMTAYFSLKNFGAEMGPLRRTYGPFLVYLRNLAGFIKLGAAGKIALSTIPRYSARLTRGYLDGRRHGNAWLRSARREGGG